MMFILGLGILAVAGIAILSSHQGFAQKLIIFAFWIFVLGTAIYEK